MSFYDGDPRFNSEKRLCVNCSYFYLDMGEPNWSELTPGADASIECSKGHWVMTQMSGVATFRRNIVKAESCADYASVQAKDSEGRSL